MRTRKVVVLVGSFFVFFFVGLVIVIGLALIIGPKVMSSTQRLAHLPVGTSSWARATPVVYATLPSRGRSTVAKGSKPTSVTLPQAPGNPVVVDDASAAAPAEAASGKSFQSDPANTATALPATSAVSSAASLAVTSPVATPLPGQTPTATPSPLPSQALTATPTPTGPPTPTAEAMGSIYGRVLLNGTPVGPGLTLSLEDQAYNTIAQVTVEDDGSYVFSNLPPSSQGYSVVFARDWNTQYEMDEVISWGWIGPVAVQSDTQVEVPEFDISLLGFEPVSPEPNAAYSVAALSPDTPLQFEWRARPQAVAYWVDLARGDDQDQEVVWQSSLSQSGTLSFDGRLEDGRTIDIGDYWWGVGARGDVGAYSVTVYGYLSALRIKP